MTVELKNVPVTEDVIPQVLRYAIWAETNPDSIRAMWLELESKPEDINVSWDNLSVKVLVVGPSLSPRALRLANKITYPISFTAVNRFSTGREEFILTEQTEPELPRKVGLTRGQEVYDQDYYVKEYNKESVPKFLQAIDVEDGIIAEKNWDLGKKMNKGYVSYKYGFPIVFGVSWIGTKSFGLFFKLPKDKAESITIPGVSPHRYEEQWNQVLYKVERPESEIRTLLPVFEAAFEYITGRTPR